VSYYEPTEVEVVRCRRGRHCRGREEGTNLPAICPRPLCDMCATTLSGVIEELPTMLGTLSRELPRGYVSMPEPRVSGGDPEPGLPIRVHVDELMRDMVACALEWADRVREVADLAWVAPDRDLARSLARSVRTLRFRISPLLALGERGAERVPRFDSAAAPRRLDGGDGALELIHVHRLAQGFTGQIRRLNRIPEPCALCGVSGGVHWDGADPVVCQACGKRFDSRDDFIEGRMTVDEQLEPVG